MFSKTHHKGLVFKGLLASLCIHDGLQSEVIQELHVGDGGYEIDGDGGAQN